MERSIESKGGRPYSANRSMAGLDGPGKERQTAMNDDIKGRIHDVREKTEEMRGYL